MYNAGQMSGKGRCFCLCAIFLITFGFTFALTSIGILAIGGVARIVGIVLLILAVICVASGIGLCCYNKKTTTGTAFPQGPIVSGSAPPGPVSGFHVQHTSQPGGYPAGYGASPSAPPPQPTGAYPPQSPSSYQPNYPNKYDSSAPPSYSDVVN